MVALYLDTSAVVKIVKRESESIALQEYLDSHGVGKGRASRLVCSEILRTELLGAVIKDGHNPRRAMDVLSRFTLIPVTTSLLDTAGRLGGERHVRSLDAIHFVTALSLADKITDFVCYDRQMSEVAQGLGLKVVSPQ